ncbi:MAG TPA: right-handed parallel beta-helix repeat-containing protein [Friedmanniella sp.]
MRTTYSRSLFRSRVLPVLVTTVAIMLAVLAVLTLRPGGWLSGATAGSAAQAALPVPGAVGAAPKVCGSTALAGPVAAPTGAVTVTTGERLSAVVSEHDPGTTYWLAPGVHRLSDAPFDQVLPKDGDRFVGAPGAVLDGQHKNRYAFGGHGAGVTISFLTVENFGAKGLNNNEGVVNHDSASGWTFESTTLQHNAGAAVMLGSQNRLLNSCLRENGQYGFNAYSADGVAGVTMEGNEIAGNNTDDWEVLEPGCGCTGGGKFWSTKDATITGNNVHDNHGVGIWVDNNNAGFLISGNWITGNDAEGVMYETSYNAAILGNTFERNGLVKGPQNKKFPTAAVYISESGADERVATAHDDALRVANNRFVDNWSGVVAWENADRFAGSPANTSTGQAPLVNPGVATATSCAERGNVSRKPYFDDCRWKTQNVLVEDNTFSVDPNNIALCAHATSCGFNGLFSNFGSYPRWSPYKGEVVAQDLAFKQNNVFRRNTYIGDWQFVAEEMGNAVGWDAWRGAPYGQDAGSTTG